MGRNQNNKQRPSRRGKNVSGKRSTDNCKNREDKFSAQEDRTDNNDVQWYASDPALLRDSASIPFSQAIGTPFYLNNPYIPDDTTVIPGLLCYKLFPTIGFSQTKADPISVAATSMYSFVRHANSGSRNYDSPDLMLYCLAMGQVYAAINWLQRTYGFGTLYTMFNRYIPRTLIQASGFDPDDVINNLADFRYGINVLVNKAASLAVPATMPYFQRSAFLYQNVYSEGDSIKDQLYMYTPAAFWQFSYEADDVTTENVGHLVMNLLPTYMTVKQALTLVNTMLEQIVTNEDMNIMSGDILKAYGGNIIKLVSVPEYYPIVPTFNITVLEQFQNATIWDFNIPADPKFKTNMSVLQNTSIGGGQLIHQPGYTLAKIPESGSQFVHAMANFMNCGNRILTTYTSNVDPGLVMENTRLMAAGRIIGQSANCPVRIGIYGATEIVGFADIYYLDGAAQVQHVDVSGAIFFNTGNDLGDEHLFQSVVACSQFKFAPLRLTGELTGYTPGGTEVPFMIKYFGVHGDVGNYAVLSYDNITKLHEAALLNMMNVPYIGKV